MANPSANPTGDDQFFPAENPYLKSKADGWDGSTPPVATSWTWARITSPSTDPTVGPAESAQLAALQQVQGEQTALIAAQNTALRELLRETSQKAVGGNTYYGFKARDSVTTATLLDVDNNYITKPFDAGGVAIWMMSGLPGQAGSGPIWAAEIAPYLFEYVTVSGYQPIVTMEKCNYEVLPTATLLQLQTKPGSISGLNVGESKDGWKRLEDTQ
ncbi:hypothetical protein [uncultured Paraglaciecola sp.]|uniref:hypothetical protein n=1 Tax=uncultured Paraglaciecola sp. TaxID=1765024 RepID=UPI00263807B0|nr:hypothetical protein [uncultured Paraglaciecola sp.]